MALRVPVASTRRTGRTRKRWGLCSLAGLLLLAGVLGGCDGDDHDDHDKAPRTQGGCLLEGEREPNDTTLIAQILDPGFAGDCISVQGNLFAATDVDTY